MSKLSSYNYAILNRRAKCVKIGYSEQDPEERLNTLQTGCPDKLEMLGYWPGSRTEESSLHQQFKEYCIRGEWFRLTPPVFNFLRPRIRPDAIPLLESIDRDLPYVLSGKETDIRPVSDEHKATLLYLDQFMTHDDFNANYRLPSPHNNWLDNARAVAKQYGIGAVQVQEIKYYKKNGDPAYGACPAYPAWIWMASWLVHAQFAYKATYDEAWNYLSSQIFPNPNSVIQYSEINTPEARICAAEERLKKLRDDNKSLSETIKVYSERFAQLRSIVNVYFQVDISLGDASQIIEEQCRRWKEKSERYNRQLWKTERLRETVAWYLKDEEEKQ